ncbi:hypothetical protein BC830DRAFT_1103583 [Chytriomyces sp. MP71]|nr:hypothetical protein BC830DRAFT_1103583 [Chytriomyces sp. MP71]
MGAGDSTMRTFFHKDDYHSFQNFTPPDGVLFTHYNAVEKESNQTVSIFTYAFRDNEDARRASTIGYDCVVPIKPKLPEKWIISNALQRLKTLRHPGILKFKDAILTSVNLYVITEPVIPLARVWNELPPEEIAVGLHRILRAVSFLHDNSLCHNNLQLSSLYLSLRKRDWLLGGLEFTTPFQDVTNFFTRSLASCVPAEIIPPEDFDPHVTAAGVVQTRDFFAMGNLLTILISKLVQEDTGKSGVFDWRELQRLADAMMSMNPARRMTVDNVLGDPVFTKNQFIYVADEFLKNTRVYGMDEKIAGFKKIVALIKSLPHSTVTAYLLPHILNLKMFSEAGIEFVFRELFSQRTSLADANCKGILPSTVFIHFVLPFISKSMTRREFDVRRIMLRLFPCYFEELFKTDPMHFLTYILPEILIGLNESNEEIYVHTFSALCLAIPRLYVYESQCGNPVDSNGNSAKPVLENRSMSRTKRGESPKRTSPVSKATIQKASFSHIPTRVLIESFVTPRVLNSVIDSELSENGKHLLLRRFTNMWKRVCMMEHVVTSVKYVVLGLNHNLKTLLNVLPPHQKDRFVTEHLMGSSRDGEEHWMPKVLEILIPFLVSSEEQLRVIIADIFMQSVTIVAQYPQQPLDQNDFQSTATLRAILRSGNAIIHTGPRHRNSDDFFINSGITTPPLKDANNDMKVRLPDIKDLPMLPNRMSFINKSFENAAIHELPQDVASVHLIHAGTGLSQKYFAVAPASRKLSRPQPSNIHSATVTYNPSQEFTEIPLEEGDTFGTRLSFTPNQGYTSHSRGNSYRLSPNKSLNSTRSMVTATSGFPRSPSRLPAEKASDALPHQLWSSEGNITDEILSACAM